MPQLASLDTAITAERQQQIRDAATTHDPDVVYLVHHYGTDDWHGAGTPYRTLASALRAAGVYSYDGPWVDAAEIMDTDRYRKEHPAIGQAPGQLWWPLEQDGELIDAADWGDNHPYIEKATVQH